MELHEKLQELRKSRGLTQEQLAQCIYVSRTAMLLFLPFFGQRADDMIQSVSLLTLTDTAFYIKISSLIIVFALFNIKHEEASVEYMI